MSSNVSGATGAPKRGKGAVLTGVLLLVLGAVLTFLGIAVPGGTAKEIANTQIGAPQTAPAEWTADLAAATTYGVYAVKDGTAVPVADVTVTAADGTKLTVNTSDSVEVKGEGGKTFTEVANFNVGTSGSFTIKVATTGAEVAVAPSIATESKALAWVVALFVGPILALIGIVLVIVGLVQRSKS
ncbi:MAG: hypothetical protein AB7G36_08245 [Candidatus Nanopelagicales bacterium]